MHSDVVRCHSFLYSGSYTTHDSLTITVLQKKQTNKYVQGKIKNFLNSIRDQRTKIRETREQLKVVKQGRCPIPANIVVGI